MSKVTNVYSLNAGLLFNFGATDLKAATNAPGLAADRKAAIYTYGALLLLESIIFILAIQSVQMPSRARAVLIGFTKIVCGKDLYLELISSSDKQTLTVKSTINKN